MFSFGSSSARKSKEILKNFYYFGETPMLDCNQYLMLDSKTKEIALFDAGNGISLNALFEGMKKLNLDYRDIKKVFITHEHVDHVLGLYPLMEIMKENPPEILAYGETAKILKEGDEAQIFPGNLGIDPGMFRVKIIPLEVTDIKEQKYVEFADFRFDIHYTPGHSLGSMSYHEPNKKILIPGDLIFTGGSFGRFDFPGGSLKKLKESIEFATTLDVIYLLPGHMGISDQGNQQIALSNRMINSMGSFFM